MNTAAIPIALVFPVLAAVALGPMTLLVVLALALFVLLAIVAAMAVVATVVARPAVGLVGMTVLTVAVARPFGLFGHGATERQHGRQGDQAGAQRARR